jgi:hypothetical protein
MQATVPDFTIFIIVANSFCAQVAGIQVGCSIGGTEDQSPNSSGYIASCRESYSQYGKVASRGYGSSF